MKSELPASNENQCSQSLDERFASRPDLRQRLFSIADTIDRAVAEGCTAHEAEARAIEQIRKLGNEGLRDWAQKSEQAAREQAQQKDPRLKPYRKKKLLSWHSTYGEVEVLEQRLRVGRRGKQVRPFCQTAQISQRAYSRPLQRALTDFGAEESFRRATEKVREHYGIDVGASAARTQTLVHAKAIGAVEHAPPGQPVQTLISQLDGSMIPMVKTGLSEDGDKRKKKELYWREVRLCCARPKDALDCVYGATLGSMNIAGLLWHETARAAGLGPQTHVHGLGDGATCIMNTFAEQFGAQGKYTVDFWHVSEYLGEAAKVVAPQTNKDWLHEQQDRLLHNEVEGVLKVLAGQAEPKDQDEAPVRSAYDYIKGRQDHLDYAGAKAAELPIGSGEIEGGHRHVIQERLKITGAWWLEQTAEWMLQLRTKRASKDWDKYWSELAKN
jgi:hypothetical protein